MSTLVWLVAGAVWVVAVAIVAGTWLAYRRAIAAGHVAARHPSSRRQRPVPHDGPRRQLAEVERS